MTEDKTAPIDGTDVKSLKKKIIRQVEFYFGDYNLMKDKFMRQKMDENEGWFSMDLMLQFKRLASICSEPITILDALKDADASLLEIDSENQRIRRKPEKKVPKDSEEYRQALNARTVYVKGFQDDESIDDIHEFLSVYGKVDGIQLQRTTDKKFKGSLFVSFNQQEVADRFINAPMEYYKGTIELSKMSRNDYYKQLENMKREKKAGKKEDAREEIPLIAIKVSGLTDETITHRDVKEVFEALGLNNILRFDRFEDCSEEGYLIFRSDDKADSFLKQCGFANGEKASVKSASVEFSIPDDSVKEKIINLYYQAKLKYSRPLKQKKFKGKFNRGSAKRKGGTKTNLDSGDERDVQANEPSEKVAKLD